MKVAPPIKAVTQHAIDRYLERTKGKSEKRAINKLFGDFNGAASIGGNEYYANGFIVVIIKGEIRTVYRPRKPRQLAAINRYFERKKRYALVDARTLDIK